MKPTFALDLSHEGIGLLHRTARGWTDVGFVPLDAPDLGASLGFLRTTALGLEANGITSKLVIPNSEILYTTVLADGPTRAARAAQIRDALDGLTPYSVDELVFAFSGEGPEVKVAVVARQTLEEAEAFAVSHGFNPVCFVAVPEPGRFHGEPFFGPTAAAATILPPGETVERDRAPIRRPKSAAVAGAETDQTGGDAAAAQKAALDDAPAGAEPRPCEAAAGDGAPPHAAGPAQTPETAPPDVRPDGSTAPPVPVAPREARQDAAQDRNREQDRRQDRDRETGQTDGGSQTAASGTPEPAGPVRPAPRPAAGGGPTDAPVQAAQGGPIPAPPSGPPADAQTAAAVPPETALLPARTAGHAAAPGAEPAAGPAPDARHPPPRRRTGGRR